MRKIIIAIAALSFSVSSFAANTSANQGHHGGGNNGAVGAAAGAFGGSTSASSGSGASGGNGGTYGDWYLRSSPVDNYQPWPESEMRRFQKP
jgi:hypothetical protein